MAEQSQKRNIPMNRAIREALEYELENDPSVFMMGEDIAVFGGVYQTATGFLEKFGEERIRDTPISEAALIASGVGAAMSGMKPVVEIMFVDFIGVCLDPLYNAGAKNAYHSDGQINTPLTIMTGCGGGYCDASQHSQTLYATLAHLPGLKTVVPSNAYDAKGLLHAAIRDPNPVIFMIHKRLTGMGWFGPIKEAAGDVPTEAYTVEIGKAAVRRQGTDVTLVGWGETYWTAEFAARILENEGVSCETIDLRTIAPLDRETIIASVKKTGRLVAIDEDYRMCGLAGEVIATAAEEGFSNLKAPPARVTFPDIPIPYSRPLEEHVRPNTDMVVEAVKKII